MASKRSASIRQSQKKSTLRKAVSLPNLKVVQDACLEEFGRSKNTKKAYKGHLARGKAFLKDLVDQKRASGTDGDCVNADKLAKAFDNPPNEYSAMALELFLTQKCFSEALGLSTGQGIHGAFANYWDEMYVLSKFPKLECWPLFTIYDLQGWTEVRGHLLVRRGSKQGLWMSSSCAIRPGGDGCHQNAVESKGGCSHSAACRCDDNRGSSNNDAVVRKRVSEQQDRA